MANNTSVLELSQVISQNALALFKANTESTGQQNGHKSNGVTKSDAPSTQTDIFATKQNLLGALHQLESLLISPELYLKTVAWSYHKLSALAVILEFSVAAHVPERGEISFSDLAKASSCHEQRLTRVLRLLTLEGIFSESTTGYVSHTPISLVLKNNHELAAFLGHCTHEAFPAASRLKDSIRTYPDTEEPSQAGFNLAFGTEDPLFTWLEKSKDRFERFNLGMKGISQDGERSGRQVVEGFDWTLVEDGGTVVDVGGGNGHIAISLANAFPKLNFVVQDLDAAIEVGREEVPKHLKNRIDFQVHNMFQQQPVIGANVYYLRHILHDWPDSWAIKILSALVPSLKPGSRILISDSVIPPKGEMDPAHERMVRYLDLQMMVLHNARERTEEDFIELLKQASPALKFQKTWRIGESLAASTMVEAIYQP